MEHHLDDGLVAVGVDDGAMVQLDQAVIQLDALGHQAPADVAADLAINRGDVGLLHLVLRVHDVLAQLAVVGHEDQALGIVVEAAHGTRARTCPR